MECVGLRPTITCGLWALAALGPAAGQSSGVDADAQLELAAEELIERPAHRERRVECPLGVILERRRCAEGRHHRVAGELLDRPACPVHLGGHRVVEALELGPRALRVLIGGERRRPDEVGEEHGGELALVGLHGRIVTRYRALISFT
jgi:hypothetical protein